MNLEIVPLLYELATIEQKKILSNVYDVRPFEIKTITVERIFVDKLFAAESYVRKADVKNKAFEAAKHIYDLTIMAKLPNIIKLINEEELLNKILTIRLKEELDRLLNQPHKTKTEIAIEIMLWIMRKQMFIDGNKRVAMLFANKMMIDEGCGIITISQENQPMFFEKLINFYETGDGADLKEWIYQTSIDGIDLN